jgi:4-hydroxybenzoate polyprenyltransferase
MTTPHRTGALRAAAGLVRACHPEPTAAVTAATAVLAFAMGRPVAGVAEVAVAMLAAQLAVGWSNDAIDARRDAAVGRTDKPIPGGQVSRRAVTVAAVVAGVATAPLAWLSGPAAAATLLLALGSAVLYNWPLKSTPLSALPFAVSFAALPAFVALSRGTPPPVWLPLACGLLGVGAHFANVLPDLDDDARTGVRGLPHRLGATGSRLAAAAALLGATAALAFGPPGPPSWPGLAALGTAAVVLPAGLYAASRRTASRVAFRAVLAVALVDVGLLLLSGTRI